jgi:hypothetical protein
MAAEAGDGADAAREAIARVIGAATFANEAPPVALRNASDRRAHIVLRRLTHGTVR